LGLIVETDLGRDPDDLFTLIWLIESGVNILAITITPGDRDQVAVARFLNNYYKLDIPIGVSDVNRTKLSSGGVHYKLLDRYKFPKEAKHDGLGSDIIAADYMSALDEVLIIGPCTNVARWIQDYNPRIDRATMQGGFLPCSMEKFKGKESMPTFNLNGDRNAGTTFLSHSIPERRMVGKNVCHGIILKKNIFTSGLNKELASIYLNGHSEKKMHDPLAAVCHFHPKIGNWVRGKTIKQGGGWTTDLSRPEDFILEGVNESEFWKILNNRN